MRRIATILATGLLLLAGVAWVCQATWGRAALAKGRSLYKHRGFVARTLARRPAGERVVVWMGDSTILGLAHAPWPEHVAASLRPHRVGGVRLTGAGRDFFQHYCLLPKVLTWKPDLVVLIANLRIMPSGRKAGRHMDLCSYLPTSTLLHSLTLPWYDRGLTLPGLALMRLLALPPLEREFLVVEGMQRLATDARTRLLGPVRPAPRPNAARRRLERTARMYAPPLTRRYPVMRMLAATVGEARHHGSQVLVVLVPVPHWVLRTAGTVDEPAMQRRVDVVRRVVEEAGGEFLDLHRLLPRQDFADQDGHYQPAGARRIATTVGPRVAAMLGLPWPTEPPAP